MGCFVFCEHDDATATASHTASLAGSMDVWKMATKQAGAISAQHMKEMLDIANAFYHLKPTHNKRVGISGGAGGSSALAADLCEEAGLDVVPFPLTLREKLKAQGSQIWDWIGNPVDMSIRTDMNDSAGNVLKLMAENPSFDLLITFINFHGPGARMKDSAKTFLEQFFIGDLNDKPLLAVMEESAQTNAFAKEILQELKVNHVPVYPSIEQAAITASKMIDFYQNIRRTYHYNRVSSSPGYRLKKISQLFAVILIAFLWGSVCHRAESAEGGRRMIVTRLDNNPIIRPDLHPRIGSNINGPSLIRVPEWIKRPLDRYYLYFSHHKGDHIRLAYSDALTGPWKIYEQGALSLEASLFPTETPSEDNFTEKQHEYLKAVRALGFDPLYAHIASPEVIVLPEQKEIRLYYHGMLETGMQATRVAISTDGIHFKALPEVITPPYLRIFRWQNHFYGLTMPGVFYRSKDGLIQFEKGPTLFNPNMRHSALLIRDYTLYVFWTQVGDTPERILLSTIDLSKDWLQWEVIDTVDVIRPVKIWEGANLSLKPSQRGAIEVPVNQLRDPTIYKENGKIWLLYSVAGESGIAIASLEFR